MYCCATALEYWENELQIHHVGLDNMTMDDVPRFDIQHSHLIRIAPRASEVRFCEGCRPGSQRRSIQTRVNIPRKHSDSCFLEWFMVDLGIEEWALTKKSAGALTNQWASTL